jgi:hypothetical protein
VFVNLCAASLLQSFWYLCGFYLVTFSSSVEEEHVPFHHLRPVGSNFNAVTWSVQA